MPAGPIQHVRLTPPLDYAASVRDPYAVWLKLLFTGATLSATGWALNGAWTYLKLSASIQGYPRQRYLALVMSYEWILQAAIVWVGSWLLTSTSPVHDTHHFYTYRARMDRTRAALIRIIRSLIFIEVSIRVWGFLGTAEPGSLLSYINFGVSCFDAIATMLVWSQVVTLCGKFGLLGIRKRAILMMLLILPGDLIMQIIPQTLLLLDYDWRMTQDQFNARNGIIVLFSILASLTLGRFAWLLRRDVISPAAGSVSLTSV